MLRSISIATLCDVTNIACGEAANVTSSRLGESADWVRIDEFAVDE
jgi:hypothetical protein